MSEQEREMLQEEGLLGEFPVVSNLNGQEKRMREAAREEVPLSELLKVTSFGSADYQSHLLPAEIEAMREQLVEFEAELHRILDEVWDVYESKGKLYDQATVVWHHFPFGLTSFASQVYLKATRFVSLMQRGKEIPLSEIDDTLKDIVVYSWYAWAYARIRARASSRGG